MVEVAELMEHFQWLTEAQSAELLPIANRLSAKNWPISCCIWCAYRTSWA